MNAEQVSQYEDQLSSASLVVLDGNIPVSTIDYVCSLAKKHSVPGISRALKTALA